MRVTSRTQPIRTAENKTMTVRTTTKARHRKFAGAFLAAVLLLVLPPAAVAQVQRVLVISYGEDGDGSLPFTVTENTADASDPNPDVSCKATYNVRLSTEPSSDVTVTVVSDDTNAAVVDTDSADGNQKTLTFRPSNWFTDLPVQVFCVNDNVANADGERRVTITNTPSGDGFRTAKDVRLTVYNEDTEVAGLTVSNTDGDVAEGNTVATVNERGDRRPDTPPGREADYTVKLMSEPTGNVVVTVTSSDTNIATVSPASLTFTPTNYDKEQTITVTGVDDRGSAVNREATITHTPGGGGYGPAQTKTVKAVVNNGGITTAEARGVELSPVSVVVGEGQRATYTLRLTAMPTGTVDVQLTRNSSEFISFDPSSLKFTETNYDEPQTVTITGFDDKVDNDPASPPDTYTYRDTLVVHRLRGGGTSYDGTESTLTVRLQDDDSAALVLNKATLRLRDTGQALPYTIKLKAQPKENVTVTPMVSGGVTAAEVSGALIFTPTNWNRAQTVTVTAENDKVDNPGSNRDVEITHTIADGASDGSDGYARIGDAPDAPAVMVTVIDTDTAGLDISRSSTSITEGGTPKTYTVRLESDATVTVTITSNDPGVTVSSATDPDCTTVTTTTVPLTFTSGSSGNWNTAQTVTICAPNNEVVNGRRTATITHTAVVTGGDQYAPDEPLQVTLNDDESTPDIILSPSFRTVYEADGQQESATYTVRLRSQPVDSNGDPTNVSVGVVSGDTSIVTVDPTRIVYAGTDDADWRRSETVTVTATQATRDDNEDNVGNRLVLVEHTASGLKGAVMRVTVADDDTAELLIATDDKERGIEEGDLVAYRVNLKSSPPDGEDVTVRIASTDPAIATVSDSDLTFTSNASGGTESWEDEQTVTVTATDDEVDNPGTTRVVNVIFTPSGGGGYGPAGPAKAKMRTVTVTDNDTARLVVSEAGLELEEGTIQPYDVSLKTPPTGTVTVTITSSNVAVAKVDTDPDTPGDQNTLTFRPNDGDDDAEDGDWDEEQTVEVTGVSAATRGDRTATITHVPAGGGYGSGQTARIKVKVKKDTSPGLRAPAQVTVAEGGTGSFTVELNSKPTGDVTVTVTNTSTSVISTVAPGSLTFSPTNWNTPQRVTVTATDDTVVTDDRRATIMLASTGEDYDDFERDVEVTVTDDDATVTVSPTSVTVPEAGGRATYTVRLDGQPTGNVTVTVASSSTAATVRPGSLTFTPSNWNSAQTVSVTGVDDSVPGGNRSATITHTASGGGYDETAVPSVSVMVTDDDGMTVAPTAVEVAEAGGTATYRVSLKTQPTGTVTVAVAVARSDTRIATATPTSMTFTPSNWAARTVTVTGVDDQVDNGASRSATITNTPSGAGYSSPVTVWVTVTDDEEAPTMAISGGEATEGNTGTRPPLRFTVTKRGATDQEVTVSYADAGTGTATAGTDYTAVVAGTLTFAPNETSKTITVMVTGDDESEKDETVVIALSNPTKATVPEGDRTATGTIIDDDASRLSIAAAAATVEEGGTVIFTVTLDPPIDDQTVTVDLIPGGTARPIQDYTFTGVPETGTLTFAAGEASKAITVTVVDDADYELDETIVAELRNPRSAGSVELEDGMAMAMVTIEDNDAPPALSISGTSVAEGNDGTTSKLTFKVTKSGGTSMVATVAYADAGTGTATAGTDYISVAPGTLIFAPDETTKTVTVTVKGDDEAEGDETVVVRLRTSPQSNATIAEGKGTATGTIIDDDTLPRVASDWLARFGRTAASATLDAIARRMNDGPASPEPSITVAGHRAAFASAPVARVAAGIAEPWEEGRFRALTIEDLANHSSFDAGDSFVEGLNVWGASSYNQFEMTPQGAYTMDGSLVSAILGVDHQGDTHVAGLALAYHGGAGDFGGIGGTAGSLGTNLYSVHPYARLTFGEAIHVGASFGIGTGDLRITDKDDTALVETGVGMPVLVALDARMELVPIEDWVLAVQTDGHFVQMVADERLPRFTRVETNTHRLRLGLENSFAFMVADGVSLASVLETGLRYDGGDATEETGFGFDVGGGLRLDAAIVGLMVDARGHASLSNWGEEREQAPALRDWGVGGVIRWRPAGDGMGPEMSLTPAYGGTLAGAAVPSLDAEIGYRMAAFGGVLTPYSGVEISVTGQQSYRAGAHFKLGQEIALSADGTHRQSPSGVVDQFLTLEMRLRQ